MDRLVFIYGIYVETTLMFPSRAVSYSLPSSREPVTGGPGRAPAEDPLARMKKTTAEAHAGRVWYRNATLIVDIQSLDGFGWAVGVQRWPEVRRIGALERWSLRTRSLVFVKKKRNYYGGL